MVLELEKARENFPDIPKNEITELARLGLSVLYPRPDSNLDLKDQQCVQALSLLSKTSAIK
jgi:hypothetical protein